MASASAADDRDQYMLSKDRRVNQFLFLEKYLAVVKIAREEIKKRRKDNYKNYLKTYQTK